MVKFRTLELTPPTPSKPPPYALNPPAIKPAKWKTPYNESFSQTSIDNAGTVLETIFNRDRNLQSPDIKLLNYIIFLTALASHPYQDAFSLYLSQPAATFISLAAKSTLSGLAASIIYFCQGNPHRCQTSFKFQGQRNMIKRNFSYKKKIR